MHPWQSSAQGADLFDAGLPDVARRPSPLPGVDSALSSPPIGRLLRFAVSGAAAGAAQLVLLTLLLDVHLGPAAGNVAAFLAATQLNFALSQWFTWKDRRAPGQLGRRWLRFMSAISSTAVLNLGLFTLVRGFAPTLVAAAGGIAIAAVANFVLADRAVFNLPGRAQPAPRAIGAPVLHKQEG